MGLSQTVTLAQLESKGVLKQNQNECTHCKRVNLPEPISWAKMCRLTGDYVCEPCYVDSLYDMMDMEDRR